MRVVFVVLAAFALAGEAQAFRVVDVYGCKSGDSLCLVRADLAGPLPDYIVRSDSELLDPYSHVGDRWSVCYTAALCKVTQVGSMETLSCDSFRYDVLNPQFPGRPYEVALTSGRLGAMGRLTTLKGKDIMQVVRELGRGRGLFRWAELPCDLAPSDSLADLRVIVNAAVRTRHGSAKAKADYTALDRSRNIAVLASSATSPPMLPVMRWMVPVVPFVNREVTICLASCDLDTSDEFRIVVDWGDGTRPVEALHLGTEAAWDEATFSHTYTKKTPRTITAIAVDQHGTESRSMQLMVWPQQ